MRRGLAAVACALLVAGACTRERERAREQAPTPTPPATLELGGEVSLAFRLQPSGASPAPGGVRLGWVTVLVDTASPGVLDCGFRRGDTAAVFWSPRTAFEPEALARDPAFPGNLGGRRVEVRGTVERPRDGLCLLVADRVRVLGAPSPSPSPSPRTPRPLRTPTPSPAPSPSPSPTATPTGSPTPT